MSARFREVVFWLHLGVGLGVGLVVFIMAATGVLLMYERQIVEWADRGYRAAPPVPDAARLPAESLLAVALSARPGSAPTSLTMQADAAAPAAIALGRETTLYLNPYDGRLLGESSPRVRAFFRGVTDWHRWLGTGEERRGIGRAISGACNLGFLILVLSGLYLWMPRKWVWRQVTNVAWFRRGLAGKARDFNWHNVIGLWAWVPLVLVVSTGVVLSYRWANDLLFRLAGEEPPPARQESGRGRTQRGGGRTAGAEALATDGLDELWTLAERRVPGWRSITMRLSDEADAPVNFTILRGHRARPDLRAQLSLDRSGEVVSWEPYSSQGPGRRLRAWARWVHTGEAGGFVGQTIAGIAAAGATVLVWTGWAMAWRRFLPQKRRRTEQPETNLFSIREPVDQSTARETP